MGVSGVSANPAIAVIKDRTVQRAPLTTLEGASYASVSGGTVSTIVTAGANVNGVVIRTLVISGSSTGYVSIGANRVFYQAAAGMLFVQNIFVPAGLAIVATTTASNIIDMAYEVL